MFLKLFLKNIIIIKLVDYDNIGNLILNIIFKIIIKKNKIIHEYSEYS